MTIKVPEWVKSAYFYQIFPDRFVKSETKTQLNNFKWQNWDDAPTYNSFKGGNLDGIRQKLDYLQDLGITALYLTPIFSSTANHRYHTYDYFNVDPLLGGNEALKILIDDLHKRNMKIILDGVFNHASRGFFAFNHVVENGKASPYVDWFHFNKFWLDTNKQINPYYEAKNDKEKNDALNYYGYMAWWNLPALPKFNIKCPAVREYLLSVAKYWIEFGVDGWRLDVPNEIDDDEFWQEFRKIVKSVNNEAYIVGEIWDNAKRWLKGDMFDAVMNYRLAKSILSFVVEKDFDKKVMLNSGYNDLFKITASQFSKNIESLFNDYDFEHTSVQLNLLGSHDTPRLFTLLNKNIDRFKLAILLLFSFSGTPCLYYGDELGMEGMHDPDCRRAFPVDITTSQNEIKNYIKQCIIMRKKYNFLTKCKPEFFIIQDNILCIILKNDNNYAVLVVNATENNYDINTNDIFNKINNINKLYKIFSSKSGLLLNYELLENDNMLKIEAGEAQMFIFSNND